MALCQKRVDRRVGMDLSDSEFRCRLGGRSSLRPFSGRILLNALLAAWPKSLTQQASPLISGAFDLLRLGDPDRPALPKPVCNDLLVAVGPVDLEAIDFFRVAKAEIKRENAL